jgi:hypothetical protein
LSTFVARRDVLVDELRAMRDRMFDTARDLETTIEGSIGDQLVMLEEARGGEGADATSISSSNGRPDPAARSHRLGAAQSGGGAIPWVLATKGLGRKA